jgi:hypothetical protein
MPIEAPADVGQHGPARVITASSLTVEPVGDVRWWLSAVGDRNLDHVASARP